MEPLILRKAVRRRQALSRGIITRRGPRVDRTVIFAEDCPRVSEVRDDEQTDLHHGGS